MNKINKNNYTVKQSAPTSYWITFNEKNKKGEELTIELLLCADSDSKNSLPKLWYKNGYTERVLDTYWSVNTYVKDSEGRSWGKYNPQTKRSEDGKRMVINFDWMMEATEENKNKIINEVYRIFSEATGKSATEEKIEKVREYAKINKLEVITEIPEGWIKVNYTTDPAGVISVCNMKPNLKAFKEGVFQRKLLLV